MALNGQGERVPTALEVATQEVTIALFQQWQTYRNGVHMDWDTFRSIDFRVLAVAAITGAGFDVTAVDAIGAVDAMIERKRETVYAQWPELRPAVDESTRAQRMQDITDELDGKVTS